MSAVRLGDFDDLIQQLSEFYDQQQTQQAILGLKHFYQHEAFDNDDITNDWIPNDFQNCHGIHIFVDKLDYSQQINNTQNKRILFEWFCHWLLTDIPRPHLKPYTISTTSTQSGRIQPISIENVATLLKQKLRSHLKIAESDQMGKFFEETCKQEDYTEVHELRSDFENVEDSFLLYELIKKYPQYRKHKTKIFELLESIVYDRYIYTPFDLKSVEFKYKDSKEMFIAAKELCMKEMESIFSGAANKYESKTDQKNEVTVDTQLIHAKALDFENRFPLLICMIDVFTRYCCEENKIYWINSGYANHPEPQNISPEIHWSVTLTAGVWLTQDALKFGKFFQSKHKETAARYGTSMQSMMGRLLPRINLNHILCDTIFDSLDIFARYALAMNNFICKLNQNANLPLQIDFWIIPRLVKAAQHHDMQISDDLFDVDMSGLGIVTTDLTESKQQMSSYMHKDKNINYLGKTNDKNNSDALIWDLGHTLNKKGYVKDTDYFVLDDHEFMHDSDPFCVQKLVKKLQRLWKQNAQWNKERYKRYIVIVDRRNPAHIRNKKMSDDTNKNQMWHDKLYLIKPKKCNIICKYFEYQLSECFAANSKDYLFPDPQLKHKDVENDFGVLESGNGYKFVLSYHIHFKNKIKVYWSFAQGMQRFFIEDINWLWQRYFNLIHENTKCQQLTTETKNELRQSKSKYKLHDDQFDDFCRQIHYF